MEYARQELSNERSHHAKESLQQKLQILIFWKKTSETTISQESKIGKGEENVFLNVDLVRNL